MKQFHKCPYCGYEEDITIEPYELPTEEEMDKASEKYSAEILPNEKAGSQVRCGLEVGFVDGFKYCINLLKGER